MRKLTLKWCGHCVWPDVNKQKFLRILKLLLAVEIKVIISLESGKLRLQNIKKISKSTFFMF